MSMVVKAITIAGCAFIVILVSLFIVTMLASYNEIKHVTIKETTYQLQEFKYGCYQDCYRIKYCDPVHGCGLSDEYYLANRVAKIYDIYEMNGVLMIVVPDDIGIYRQSTIKNDVFGGKFSFEFK